MTIPSDLKLYETGTFVRYIIPNVFVDLYESNKNFIMTDSVVDEGHEIKVPIVSGHAAAFKYLLQLIVQFQWVFEILKVLLQRHLSKPNLKSNFLVSRILQMFSSTSNCYKVRMARNRALFVSCLTFFIRNSIGNSSSWILQKIFNKFLRDLLVHIWSSICLISIVIEYLCFWNRQSTETCLL